MKISIWVCCPRSVMFALRRFTVLHPKGGSTFGEQTTVRWKPCCYLLNLMKLFVFTPSSLFWVLFNTNHCMRHMNGYNFADIVPFCILFLPPGGHGDMFVMGLWTSLVKFMPWYSQTDRKCLLTCNILSFLLLTKSQWSIDITVYRNVRLYVRTSLFTDSY